MDKAQEGLRMRKDYVFKAEELWAKMIEAKCQYCKHFKGGHSFCAYFFPNVDLALSVLRSQDCRKYEWENKLTKYDFEEIA